VTETKNPPKRVSVLATSISGYEFFYFFSIHSCLLKQNPCGLFIVQANSPDIDAIGAALFLVKQSSVRLAFVMVIEA